MTRPALAPLIRSAALCSALCASSLPALATADGPDAWQVIGVAENDVLNIRMGPGTEYPVIGSFGPHARHLQAITCVPFSTYGIFNSLTPAQRQSLPQSWCMVFGGAQGKGWVAQRFLAEDTLGPDRPVVSSAEAPPPFDIAVPLVRNLYRRHAGGFADVTGPDARLDLYRSYFFVGLARKLAQGLDFDPLFDGQDFNISDLRVGLDPQNPIRHGVVTVIVQFRNFGMEQWARVLVRADGQQGGAFRIFRIEHQSGQIVE
ncbi:MAG: hypothetical protein WCD16_08585 [Paracoccaceae bacterium]